MSLRRTEVVAGSIYQNEVKEREVVAVNPPNEVLPEGRVVYQEYIGSLDGDNRVRMGMCSIRGFNRWVRDSSSVLV